MMALGGMSVGRDDLKYIYSLRTSLDSFAYVGKLVMSYALDRLRGHRRGTRLVNGNALVGRLALSVKERGIPLWLEAPLQGLVTREGRVVGAELVRDGRHVRVRALRAVVLACGGQAASDVYQARYLHVRQGQEHYTVVPASNTGDGIAAAVSDADADVVTDLHHPAAWAPVSLVPLPDGSIDRFPHFIDRGKPGFIAIAPDGTRFVNESLSYHDFVPAMIKVCAHRPLVEAFLVCDHHTVRRFGIGAAPPAPGSLRPYLRSGYVFRGETLRALAEAIGVDAAQLERTVDRFNADARQGLDTQFGRGSDAYQRFNGSKQCPSANPTLAPIERGPFYAVRLVPGDIGSFSGLRTNAQAQVIDKQGAPIPGLYACGNDMASVMGGAYPGAGITIGPALTFAWLAVQDIEARSRISSPAEAA
jgi:succinate dehydrogenase/fumarate reductase flavoprotein subunit